MNKKQVENIKSWNRSENEVFETEIPIRKEEEDPGESVKNCRNSFGDKDLKLQAREREKEVDEVSIKINKSAKKLYRDIRRLRGRTG